MNRRLLRRVLFGAAVGLFLLQVLRIGRRRDRRVSRKAMVRVNKHVLNALMMRWAGRGSYPALIHHIGRRSGKAYATPVMVQATPEGFVIPLPYGADTDWCQNVRKAGTATLEHKGESFTVVDPQVIDAEAALPLLSSRRRRAVQRIHVAQFLAVKTIAEMPTVRSEPATVAASA
jgi:deazaflavin-dependent oxidoreductase (nitroreductase family)